MDATAHVKPNCRLARFCRPLPNVPRTLACIPASLIAQLVDNSFRELLVLRDRNVSKTRNSPKTTSRDEIRRSLTQKSQFLIELNANSASQSPGEIETTG